MLRWTRDERLPMEHPDNLDAAVVDSRPDSDLSVATVREWVATDLSACTVPVIVERRNELPRTITGKVIKSRLVEFENVRDGGDHRQTKKVEEMTT
jgi:acyl-CoA synthetase (AMP-forming)/AMP-acid ligase II